MKILVCGGRNYNDYDKVIKILNLFMRDSGISEIIQGGATGADALAKRYAEYYNMPIKEFKADWDKHGRSAGPIRNKQMLEEGKPDLVVAFPGGAGTENMINLARTANVDILIVGDKNGK